MDQSKEAEQKKRKLHSIDQQTSSSAMASKLLPNTRAGRITPQHGISYQTECTILVSLRAYEMQQKDDINFTITLEDPQGGKFDDIVLRIASQKTAVYMQCKHKLPKTKSTEESIKPPNSSNQETTAQNASTDEINSQNSSTPEDNTLNKKQKAEVSIPPNAFLCADGPFSIPMYFTSFLEMSPSLLENNYYFLCTNATIDPNIVGYFSEIRLAPSMAHIFSCYKDLHNTFYEFKKNNQWTILNEKLKYASLSCLGKTLAKCIYVQQTINRTTLLDSKYAVLVINIIERCDQATAISSDQTIFTCKFKEAFIAADAPTEFVKIREAFCKEYQQLLGKGKDIWEDVKKKKIKMDLDFELSAVDDGFNLMNKESPQRSFAMIDKQIEDFYSKFRLICTPDEETLRDSSKRLLIKLRDTEPETALMVYRQTIFEVYKNEEVLEINHNYLNGFFQKLKQNFAFTKLKTSTKEYTETLKQRFPYGLVSRQWLESSRFYQFLESDSTDVFYCYGSSFDLDFSAMILLETANLRKFECLFIHESSFHQSKALEHILENVLKYIEANLSSTLYIIVVLGKLESVTLQSFNNIRRSHRQRLVILTPFVEQEESLEKSLLVLDLAQEARNKLFLDNNQLHFFGTSISIDSLVQETDDLSFMQKVTKFYSETKRTDKTNINLHNYNKIRDSYVQRNVETYSPSKTQDSSSNREIKICFEVLKSSIVHQTHSFDEMNNTFDEPICKPTRTLVQFALSETEQESKISYLFDKSSGNKCMVLLNKAGFGKSTYFTWLACRLSEIHPTLFVVKLNAIEYSSKFFQLQRSQATLDDSELIRILYRFVSLALGELNVNERLLTELNEEKHEPVASLLYFSKGQALIDESKTKCQSFEQLFKLRLFCSKFNAKQLVLLFDAYDEICPDYADIVIRCFARFSKFDGICKIYFSSRLHEFQDDFKSAFTNYKLFQLQPFSHVQQIRSLHKYFLNKVNEYQNLEENYQPVVLAVVYTVLINRLDDLVKAPLLLHMAIDAFLPVVKQHIFFAEKTISGKVIVTEKFQTYDIVRSFVERKLEILITEKSGSTGAAAKTVNAQRKDHLFLEQVVKSHAILAIYALFDKSYVNKIVSNKKLESAVKRIEQEVGKAGIIVEIKNNIPLFAHRTLAEYMAALWLLNNKDKLKTDPYFKSQLFWMRGFDKIRYFFNHMIAREKGNSDIHIAVLNKSLEEVKTLLENNSSLVAVKDAGGRIPLLLALQHDNHEVMLFLLEKMSSMNPSNMINEKDDLLKWNALDYAFVTRSKVAIRALLDFGATIDMATLQDQLLSNDDDNLLMQAYHYINQIASAEDRTHLATWTVNRLCKDRKVDINSQRESLEHSTILQYCIAKNAYDLFRQFILQLDKASDVLSIMGYYLLRAVLARNAYNFVCFLIDEVNLHPPQIKNIDEAIKSAIELDRIVSLRIFLDQLCSLLNICSASNASIVVKDSENNIQPLKDDQMPKCCCVRKPETVLLPLPEYNERNVLNKDHLFESLLAIAAHEGNVRIMSYIVQRFQKPITNRTIVTVMRLLRKGKRLIHNQSVRAFKFLLDQTTDLNNIDEHGRNLLHMTIENGCFFMVQCLLETGFDHTLINENNRWNIFHYIAASESKHNNRAFKLYQLFGSLERTDHFDSVDRDGNNVYETAILNYNFDIARDVIESTQSVPEPSKRVEFVEKTVARLHKKPENLGVVLEYFKYLFEFGDIVWMETYSKIRKKYQII